MEDGSDSELCASDKHDAFSNVPENPMIIQPHEEKDSTSGKNEKKQMEAIHELHPIEFIDMTEPEYEINSCNNEEMEEERSQIVYLRKSHVRSRSKSRLHNKTKMDPIIQDLNHI